jgi:hypothetical protein
MLKFGKVPGSNSCIEKKFKLVTRKYEEYKGVCFGNGDCALVVDVWIHQVDEDASGLEEMYTCSNTALGRKRKNRWFCFFYI